MNESTTSKMDWGDGGGAKRKRRFPPWLWWGCGGGCLLGTLIVGVLAILSVRLFNEARDPEEQWPKLAEVLAFDQRPTNLELEFGLGIGADQFHLVDREHRLRATLYRFPDSGLERDHLAEPLPPVEGEHGTLTVQGREVRVLRFERLRFQPAVESLGPGIRVSLSSESGRARMLELRRMGSGRIEDEEVEAFLAPFDVWRGR